MYIYMYICMYVCIYIYIYAVAYLEPIKHLRWSISAKVINCLKPLTIFEKSAVLVV